MRSSSGMPWSTHTRPAGPSGGPERVPCLTGSGTFNIRRCFCTVAVAKPIHVPVRMPGRRVCAHCNRGKTHYVCCGCGKWYHVGCFAVAHGVTGVVEADAEEEGDEAEEDGSEREESGDDTEEESEEEGEEDEEEESEEEEQSDGEEDEDMEDDED